MAHLGGMDMSSKRIRQLINEIFEEEALAIGGLLAIQNIDDDLVWRLVRNLDSIRHRALKRVDAVEVDGEENASRFRIDTKPHPAIQDFLLAIRRS